MDETFHILMEVWISGRGSKGDRERKKKKKEYGGLEVPVIIYFLGVWQNMLPGYVIKNRNVGFMVV